MKPKAIAHRGYSGTEPENTLLAFQKAVDVNCDGIELDVHKTADNQVIVFHDLEIEIEPRKKVQISSLTLLEIKSIDLPKNQKIPTLKEVLNLIDKKCLVNIELKGNNTEKLVVQIIRDFVANKNWKYSDFLVSSFKPDMLLTMQSIDTKIQLGIITDINLEQAIDFAQANHLFSIHPNHKTLNHQEIKRIQATGIKIFAWTANEILDIKLLSDMGVDGIISDFPDRI